MHDLRHCAATFLKASGSDLKDIQEVLGLSSITVAANTYTSVVHELESERAKAEAASALVPRRSSAAAGTRASQPHENDPGGPEATPCEPTVDHRRRPDLVESTHFAAGMSPSLTPTLPRRAWPVTAHVASASAHPYVGMYGSSWCTRWAEESSAHWPERVIHAS
nr:hypothetical protein [Actinoplanes subtropicus]